MKKPAPQASPPAPSPGGAMSAGLRRYLYFTALVTGAAVLVVEILGAKMLSPYVGTSHFVWTAQIAVTLMSLATGYYLGGRLADRSQNLSRLFVCLLGAGVCLAFSVNLCRPVAFWALQYRLAAGALIASTFLFFLPLTLLATTGPFLIRVFTTGVSSVGGNAGRLSAVSTLGSVIGTVLIGYVLIPFLPNSWTMFLTSASLLVLAVVYFLVWGKSKTGAIPVAVASAGLGFAGVHADLNSRFNNAEQLTRINSNFGELRVVDWKQRNERLYLNDGLFQNTYDPAEKKSESLFTYMLHGLAHAYSRKIDNVLCIGMGVGIVPMQFANEGVKTDVVEINPAIVPVAIRYFDLKPEKLNLSIGDGREFLNATKGQYDAVVLDAFLGDSTPAHLMTREAFTAMRDHLRPEGVLVINSFGDDLGPDFMTASLDKTLRAVFKNVRIHASGNGNIFFVASDQAELKILNEYPVDQAHRVVQPQIKNAFNGLRTTDPAHGVVLTDDFNPVEFYDAQNREKMRQSLAIFLRDL
ncbi:MAG TPA: fused MFS/spermidine synthase [Verrucomicrobiae bacterium]|nr:fused MFS/spermidine synthase [Verrucomicrobiae bacterium]